MEYVNFRGEDQTLFIKRVKSLSGLTWDEFSKKYKVYKRSLFFYASNDVLMPYWFFTKLCEDFNIKEQEYHIKLIEINNKEKKIQIPGNSELLAEFLGALNGDGHMEGITNEICIVSHKILDYNYITKVIPDHMKTLFDLNPSINVQGNLIKARKYSKNLVILLNKKYGVPIGYKLNKLKIPKFVYDNRKFQIAYLCGLFDTDGTFYGRRRNEPVLGYTSLNPKYLISVKNLLNKNGFDFDITGKDLYLYNKEQIKRFFNEVKPQNEKHTLKYKIFKETGKILKTKELMRYMMHR